MSRSRNTIILPVVAAIIILVLCPPALVIAADGILDQWASAHETLLDEWLFGTDGAPLPEEGLRFAVDTGEWVLESGTVRPMQPLADGSVTGLVFEGQGRFRLAIPDPVEQDQLPRFTGSPVPDKLELTFSRMVLRTTNRGLIDRFPAATGTRCKKDRTARARRQWWQERARFDVDARIIAGLLNGDGEYLALDMDTADHGWLFYEFEPWRKEEARLCRMRKSYDFVEVWVSLDRAEHRRADGRPGSIATPRLDLVHADLELDLMNKRHRRTSGRETPSTPFRARMVFESACDGLQALPLRLYSYSRNVTATTGEGEALPVLRAPLGRMFAKIDRREEDSALLVILDQPLTAGEQVEITFDWERQISGSPAPWTWSYKSWGGRDWYPPLTHQRGRSWYPEPLEGWDDRHTARVTMTHPDPINVQATGTPVAGRREGDALISSWTCETPLKAAAFSYGRHCSERRILVEGLPEIISFGRNQWQEVGDTVEIVATHMADSIQFYQETFDHALPQDTVTGTSGGPSQTYSAFIIYGVDLAHTWDSERALANNTAELFWGDRLDWESYRDQWLADALAGYSAMMYLEAVSEGWGRLKRGVIGTYDEYLRLRQRELAYITADRTKGMGPLALGFRDWVPELARRSYVPNSRKGIAVLHMLRGILRNRAEDGEDRFEAILADFLKRHAGGAASTRDFIAAVDRVTGEDWGWFFDQWVYGTDIPSYSWSHTLAAEPGDDGRWRLEIALAQSGVPDGFRMPVPFGLEYEDGGTEVLPLVLDRPSKTFTLDLDRRPTSVTFDPNHELLHVKE